jgi:hypothetical protein
VNRAAVRSRPELGGVLDWINTRDAIQRAQTQHDDAAGPARFFLINASSRSEHTCPGEMSKSFRFMQMAAQVISSESGDWLTSMELTAAAALDRYIGCWKPYATSHVELDSDEAVQEEVRNTARALVEGVKAIRSGKQTTPGADLESPREK